MRDRVRLHAAFVNYDFNIHENLRLLIILFASFDEIFQTFLFLIFRKVISFDGECKVLGVTRRRSWPLSNARLG